MASKITYDEISRTQVGDNRNVVISKCSAGGFTIAQQIVVKENGADFGTFLKGAIRIKDIEALQNLQDAIAVAISKAEQDQQNDNVEWDE